MERETGTSFLLELESAAELRVLRLLLTAQQLCEEGPSCHSGPPSNQSWHEAKAPGAALPAASRLRLPRPRWPHPCLPCVPFPVTPPGCPY